tara:strand:+ start:498 stop:773 length:276 start_codon:yes stop_codon:yes gene_type:complete
MYSKTHINNKVKEFMRRKLATQSQMGGEHYKKDIQPIQYIYANNLSYCMGNVLKYITRKKDNRVQDLLKAKHYIDLELELVHKCDPDGKRI